jgi:tetraacyldisaccharide 4'-kinase
MPDHSAGRPRRRAGATLLSAPWAAVTGLRNSAYDRGLLATHEAGIPVLCVGNLSLGGVGKSPLVMHLARTLAAGAALPLGGLPWPDAGTLRGPVAVLSRGYGRRSRGFVLVSRGDGPLVPVAESGDEPAVCARLCPGVQVAVCEDRVEGARRLRELGCGCVLLDDGFQHRRLHRDLDVLVWDCGLDPADEALLPFGRLREHPCGARRARRPGLLPCHRPGAAGTETGLVPHGITQAPAWSLVLEPDGLVEPLSGKPAPLPGSPWGVFCGLGNPVQFEQAVRLAPGAIRPGATGSRITTISRRATSRNWPTRFAARDSPAWSPPGRMPCACPRITACPSPCSDRSVHGCNRSPARLRLPQRSPAQSPDHDSSRTRPAPHPRYTDSS